MEEKADAATQSSAVLADTMPGGPLAGSTGRTDLPAATPPSPWKIQLHERQPCASFSSILNEEFEASKPSTHTRGSGAKLPRASAAASSYFASSSSLKHLAGFYFQESASRKHECSRELSHSHSGSDDALLLISSGSRSSAEELSPSHVETEIEEEDEDEDEEDVAGSSRLFDEEKDLPSQLKNLTGPSISATEGIHILSSSIGGQKLANRPKGRASLPDWRMKRLKRERFVYANFRFIVRDDSESFGERRLFGPGKLCRPEKCLNALSHPDIYPPWSDVVAVIQNVISPMEVGHGAAHFQLLEARMPGFPSCPICLSERMLCPRLTPCGHAFCWPCLLHHLAQGEAKWRPCPICFETFSKKELKILIFDYEASPATGSSMTMLKTISFQRMKRLPGAILCTSEPYPEAASEGNGDARHLPLSLLPHFDIPHNVEDEGLSVADFHYGGLGVLAAAPVHPLRYSKYCLASSLWTVRALLEREMSLLLKEFHAAISCEEWSVIPFIEMAMEEIRAHVYREEEQTLKTALEASALSAADALLASPLPQKQKLEEEGIEPLGLHFQEASVFYQIADGRPIFVHPFSEHGSDRTCHALSQLHLCIDSVQEFTMTRELRKRFSRYFLHLPLGCKFYTCLSSSRPSLE